MGSTVINYVGLLPIGEEPSFRRWAEKWLFQHSALMQGTVNPEDMAELRERNERLSAVLPTLEIILACIRTEIARQEKLYESENPRPADGKGITAWREARDSHMSDYSTFQKLVEGLQETVATRLSVGQTNLRTKGDEVKHGL